MKKQKIAFIVKKIPKHTKNSKLNFFIPNKNNINIGFKGKQCKGEISA